MGMSHPGVSPGSPAPSVRESRRQTAVVRHTASPTGRADLDHPGDPMSVLNSDLAHRSETPGTANSMSLANSKISVIVVAAERLFRLGLARLLGEDERLDVIGVSEGESELVDLCAASSVDVVLIDLDLTKADSIGLVRLLASECPATKSLILASQADWRVRPAMIAGSAGILLKDTSPESIRAAVISVHLGDQVLCNEAARWVLGEEYSTHLTQRESDVLRMVAQGANNAEIAAELNLGQKTVRNYVSRIYGKLELTNRSQIATYLARTEVRLAVPISPTWRPADNESRVRERMNEQPLNIRSVNSGDLATPRPWSWSSRCCADWRGSPTGSSSPPKATSRRPGTPPARREIDLRRVQHRHGGGDRQEYAGPGRCRSQALATARSTGSEETGVRQPSRADRSCRLRRKGATSSDAVRLANGVAASFIQYVTQLGAGYSGPAVAALRHQSNHLRSKSTTCRRRSTPCRTA